MSNNHIFDIFIYKNKQDAAYTHILEKKKKPFEH